MWAISIWRLVLGIFAGKRYAGRRDVWRVAVGTAAAVVLGWLTRWALYRLGIDIPYMAFFPWIVLAGALWGTESAVAAVVAFVLIGAMELVPTTLVPTRSPLAGLALFAGAGLLLAMFLAWGNHLRRRINVGSVRLRDKDERLKEALAAGRMGTWDWDLATGRLAWSADLEQIHGRRPGSFDGTLESAMAHVHAADRERVKRALDAAVRGRSDYRMEYRITTAEGQERWLEARGRVICDGKGAAAAVRMTGICMDVTDRKLAELAELATRSALDDANRRFQLLTETVPGFVWSCAANGTVEYVNPRYVAYCGLTAELANDGGWRAIVHPGDQAAVEAAWGRSLATGEPFELEYRMKGKADGAYRWFLNRTVPARDETGKVMRWVGSATDVHDTKMAREEREVLLLAERAAREAAEKASKVKDEFMAVLSHELRTPLTPALLTASLLESNEDLPALVREDLSAIRRNVELEARLIDDLLDLTRISHGKIRYEMQNVDLHILLRSAILLCSGEGKVKVGTAFGAERSEVRGDPARLQQVFCNLLNNALKFTPAGGEIWVRTENIDGSIYVEVADTGEGIGAEALPKIFDAFEQGDVVRARKFGGLGLGLAIAKAMVEAHDGRISARSDGRGKGTTFGVSLPVGHVTAPHVAGPAVETAGSTARLRLLLVEDHPSTLQVLERLLLKLGHEVCAASTVAEATRSAEAGRFDLLISDLGLPDGTGYELMARLRAAYGMRGIALSGYGMAEDIERSLAAGFGIHLVKPVDLAALRAAVGRMGAGVEVVNS